MGTFRQWLSACVVLAAFLAMGGPVGAVIKVDLPLSKLFKASSTVMAGTIGAVEQDRRALEIKVTQQFKGRSPDLIRVQFAANEELLKFVRVGQPLVLIDNASGTRSPAVVHVADTWLMAQRVPNVDPPLWRCNGPYQGSSSFPGRTAALLSILKDIQEGKPGIQDWISHEAFLGGVYKRAKLEVDRPVFMCAPDLDGDGELEVIVGTAAGVRAWRGGRSYTDATEQFGLTGATARQAAVGDVNGDGKPDLLLDHRIFLNNGGRLGATGSALQLSKPDQWLAVVLMDVTNDGKADVVVLEKDGTLIRAANPGDATQPWKTTRIALWTGEPAASAAGFSSDFGDDGLAHVLVVRGDGLFRYPVAGASHAADDMARLTGVSFSSYQWLGARPPRVLLGTALDYDGTGKTDFILVTQGGGMTLANRGHGAFLINRFLHEQFNHASTVKLPKLAFELTADTLTTPGKKVLMKNKRLRQNLLVLRPDGELWEMDNTRK